MIREKNTILESCYVKNSVNRIENIVNGRNKSVPYKIVKGYAEIFYQLIDHEAINDILNTKRDENLNNGIIKPVKLLIVSDTSMSNLSGFIYDKIRDEMLMADYEIELKFFSISDGNIIDKSELIDKKYSFLNEVDWNMVDAVLFLSDILDKESNFLELADYITKQNNSIILNSISMILDEDYMDPLVNKDIALICNYITSKSEALEFIGEDDNINFYSEDYQKKLKKSSQSTRCYGSLYTDFSIDYKTYYGYDTRYEESDTYEIYNAAEKIYNQVYKPMEYVTIGYDEDMPVSMYLASSINEKSAPIDTYLQLINRDTISNIIPMEIMIYLTYNPDERLIDELITELKKKNYKKLIVLQIKERVSD